MTHVLSGNRSQAGADEIPKWAALRVYRFRTADLRLLDGGRIGNGGERSVLGFQPLVSRDGRISRGCADDQEGEDYREEVHWDECRRDSAVCKVRGCWQLTLVRQCPQRLRHNPKCIN